MKYLLVLLRSDVLDHTNDNNAVRPTHTVLTQCHGTAFVPCSLTRRHRVLKSSFHLKQCSHCAAASAVSKLKTYFELLAVSGLAKSSRSVCRSPFRVVLGGLLEQPPSSAVATSGRPPPALLPTLTPPPAAAPCSSKCIDLLAV